MREASGLSGRITHTQSVRNAASTSRLSAEEGGKGLTDTEINLVRGQKIEDPRRGMEHCA
ncbi:MAG: hypothetical protein QNJ43_22095 [Breoghania sp.]|nr:hypothetical protein [Breoghania sp.]